MTTPVRAQGSLEIYGLVDVSVKTVDNFGGGRRTSQDSGDQQGPRLGFRGSEALGNGLRTLFVLENGVNIDTGGYAQGGVPFGRQVWLGLSSPVLGTLSAGRQYDFMVELGAFHGVQQGTGTLDWNVGDNDRVSGQRLDNSLKYVFGNQGLAAGALYSVRESSAAAKTPGATSYLAKYSVGQWSMAMAATLMRDAPVAPFASLGVSEFLGMPTVSTHGTATVIANHVDNYGAGLGYARGAWSILGLFTETRYARGMSRQAMQNRNLALRYEAGGGLVVAFSVADSSLGSASWKRAAIAADYFLSKRTDLYLYALAEHASGPGTRAVLFTTAPASDARQSAVVAGFRHKF